MIKAGIITIGDEILIGQIVDTNSAWLGQALTQKGITVAEIASIADEEQQIIDALDRLRSSVDLVVITGGLGPTSDDRTKLAICRYFDTELSFHEPSYQSILTLFASFGKNPSEAHRQQAYLPVDGVKLVNLLGTAPGIVMSKEGVKFVFMPGVPYEMKSMYDHALSPLIHTWFALPPLRFITLQTVGLGESVIAERISDIEDAMPDTMSLAYLPSIASVRLRVSDYGQDSDAQERVLSWTTKIKERLGDVVFGEDGMTLEEVVGRMLRHQGKKLTLAESCTGGHVAHLITLVPGASDYFVGSIVSYDNALKTSELGVSQEVLEREGAVSEEVVQQMALGALKRYGADVALAISGIAGPGGGTEDKPVGTVWMTVSDGDRMMTHKFRFGKTRGLNIEYSGVNGLNMIRKFLLGSEMK